MSALGISLNSLRYTSAVSISGGSRLCGRSLRISASRRNTGTRTSSGRFQNCHQCLKKRRPTVSPRAKTSIRSNTSKSTCMLMPQRLTSCMAASIAARSRRL